MSLMSASFNVGDRVLQKYRHYNHARAEMLEESV